MKFDELPEIYRNAINDEIADAVGDEDKEITMAFKEWEATSLLDCEISNTDDLQKDRFGDELCAYRAGWKEREILAEGRLL